MDELLISFLRKQPPMAKPKGLTTEMTIRYADESIGRYVQMLASYREFGSDSCVVPSECNIYLQIWREVLRQEGVWEKLDNLARNEVRGEYYDQDGAE